MKTSCLTLAHACNVFHKINNCTFDYNCIIHVTFCKLHALLQAINKEAFTKCKKKYIVKQFILSMLTIVSYKKN